MVQPFLTAASLDLSARVCVVAFSVAIPLLAALVWSTARSSSVVVRPGPPSSPSRRRSRGTPPSSAWSPGWGILVSGLAGVAVHTTAYMRLERDVEPTSQEAEEPGDTE
jgi:hypothetical protein